MLRADVDGQILMRAYLSGTPECKFGLNDKLVLQKRFVTSSHLMDSELNSGDRTTGRAQKTRSSWTIANSINAYDWANSTLIAQSRSFRQMANSN